MIGDFIIYEGQRYRVCSEAVDFDYSKSILTLECTPTDSRRSIYRLPRGNGKLYMALKDTFEIEKVIFNNPATIVLWKDGTKTVVKCSEYDLYDTQTGLLMCIAKKAYGNGGRFNDVIREHVTDNPLIKAIRDMCQTVKTALIGRDSDF